MGIAFSASLVVQTYEVERFLSVKRTGKRASTERRAHHAHHHDLSERLLSRDIRAMQKRIRAETQVAAGKIAAAGVTTNAPGASKLEAVHQGRMNTTNTTTKTKKARPRHPLAQMVLPEHSPTQAVQIAIKQPKEQPKRGKLDESAEDWETTSLSKTSPSQLRAMDLTDLPESLLGHPDEPELECTAEEEEMLKGIMERAAERNKRRREAQRKGERTGAYGRMGVEHRSTLDV